MSDETLAPIAALLKANNLTVEDLAEYHAASGNTTGDSNAPTLSEFLEDLRKCLTEGTLRGYDTHFKRLESGIEWLCACDCDACITEWSDRGTCSCTCRTCERTALEWKAAGTRPMRKGEFRRSELEPFAELAQRLARKRALVQNKSRARRGLSAKPTHGQGGREMAVAALRCLFERAVDDELFSRNPAEKIGKGARGEPKRRALSSSEIEELFGVVVNGGDDPELDLLIFWAELELGARRSGVIALTIGTLLEQRQTARLHEKGRKEREQPLSAELRDALIAHSVRRGGTRCIEGHPDFDPNAPVLFHRDSTPEHPHALTSRRFDTLHRRIQPELPWANEMMFSGHALRHTLGTITDRLRGGKVAEAMLGHGPRRPTDMYTRVRGLYGSGRWPKPSRPSPALRTRWPRTVMGRTPWELRRPVKATTRPGSSWAGLSAL